MAKTESTAVNELIDLVQNNRPLPINEPGDSLFEVAPLPRTRAAKSTGTHVRVTEAPPSRGTTIPPLPPRASLPSITTRVTRESLPPPIPGAAVARNSAVIAAPPAPPARLAPPAPPAPPAPSASRAPASARASSPRTSRPSLPPPLPRSTATAAARMAAGTLPPPSLPVAAPFDITRARELVLEPVHDFDAKSVGTARTRRYDLASLAKKLALPALACIAAGVGLGIALSNKTKPARVPASTIASQRPAAAPTLAAAPATETVLHPSPRSVESQNAGTASAGGVMPEPPTKEEQAATIAEAAAETERRAGSLTADAPATALAGVAEIQTTKGIVRLVDVRIDTDPQGASITLVDRGKQFPLGSTPLSTALDASRQYDVIIEASGRAPQMVKLDPAATTRLDISLGGKQRAAVAPATPDEYPAPPSSSSKPAADTERAPAPAPKPTAKPADKPADKRTEPSEKAKPAEKPADKAVASSIDSLLDEAVPSVGTLMVSSKPPCELVIDGAATGLTTPQRSIELAPGKHKVTFVNKEAGIEKTVTVTIKAGKPTKLIQDLLGDVLP